MMRARMAGLLGGAMLVVGGLAVAPAPATASPGGGGAAVTSGVRLVTTKHSLLGVHQWYAQEANGLPVLGGYYAVHTGSHGAVTVDDGRLAVSSNVARSATVTAASAQQRAVSAVQVASAAAASTAGKVGPQLLAGQAPTSTTAALAIQPGAQSRLVWRVVGHSPSGSTQTLVDATSGAVLSTTSLTKEVNGTGKVFDPNPVVSLKNESLKDQNDSNAAVPAAAYKTVTLTNLAAGSKLTGDYVKIRNGNIASSTTRVYSYQRNADQFEQVEAYYQLTQAQKFIQSLGFNDVNNEPQDVFTDTIPDDNSFYDDSNDTITYGRGGVDDAEDAEVVWHEYGHAIQDDEVPGFGSSEQAGAIGEGFGDYFAVTMSQPVSNGFNVPCVMDWDSTFYTSTVPHCLRRTDTNKTTADIDGEVHDDGEIWSRALWDINKSLGRVKATRIVLEAQFSYRPDTSFAQAANVTVNTAKSLYGTTVSSTVKQAFVARKIL
ncbi:MAG: M36 family metallopeptidase [Actinomycetales bacterium]